ncbi:MAG: M36 family metallopeptidase, partial [Bacteroidota bacterium]
MKKLYTAILSLLLFFAGFHLQAQNTNDKILLDLVRKNAVLLHLSPTDAGNVMISHSFVDSSTNIRYVYLQQAYQHIKVYNSIMTVIFRYNEVLYSSGKFVDNLAEKAGTDLASPSVMAPEAINFAAAHLKLPVPSGLNSVENKFTAEKKIIFSSAGIAKSNIETELLWVAADDNSSVKLAWNVNIDEARSSDWWNVRIDAMTGAFLEKNNWTVHEKRAMESDENLGTGNKRNEVLTRVETDIPGELNLAGTQNTTFTQYAPPTVTSAGYFISQQPSESPRHNPMVLVTNPWLRAGATNPAITNGWHFDGTTNYDITRGNNVHAYLDVANSNNPASATNIPLVSTTVNPSLTFNYPPGFTQQPGVTANRQAAVTNLFYWNNTIHDILYQYGFNELSGNFQTDNLGRGGAGNDYVQAEGQDGGGTDNANFSTPADGTRPRMQMYLWSGVPTFTVNSPAVIGGNYFATESGFSTANKLINVGSRTGQVVYFNDDAGGTTHMACAAPFNSVTGKIAMIDRGVCGFIVKVKAAQDAGAIAVIMVNNAPGFPITMGGTDNTITIPAVMLSQSDGALLAAQLANNLNVTLTAGVGLDGDFDNGVITHEYGHGVSNRLTGGAPNSGCLGNAEQGGEGWSDYLGLMLTTNWVTARTTDGPLPRAIGIFAVGQPLNGTGIRTYPYSTDMAINPHTYTNVANPAQAGEVHYIGEIWCATIWDMTWNIIQQEGTINPNIYDGTVNAGNSIALKLVMEGMRLQTCRPGFLDARDGILAADSVLYNGRHRCAIWAAFARRGMGLSAVQGSSNSTSDGIAAFDVPSLVQLDKKATPLTVIQGEQVAINLTATCQCLINTNYTLRDTIPAGFTYVSSTGGTLAGNVVTFPTLNFSATQETKPYTIILS